MAFVFSRLCVFSFHPHVRARTIFGRNAEGEAERGTPPPAIYHWHYAHGSTSLTRLPCVATSRALSSRSSEALVGAGRTLASAFPTPPLLAGNGSKKTKLWCRVECR